MDQGRIAGITGLSRRTIQNALSNLITDGRIHERPDLHDMRRKVYSIK
jgi:DNA-binding MarR family transcriptional regulator